MEENICRLEEEFMNYVNKMAAFKEALSLITWDMRTGAPEAGMKQRANVIGALSSEIFRMSTSEEMAAYIAIITKKEVNGRLSPVTKKTADHCKKEYERNRRIPPDKHKEYVILRSKAETVWQEAKRKADFEKFRPWLEKLVEFNKYFIDCWGYRGNKYNTLLDLYEPGMTVDILDQVFAEIRRKIIPLVKAIARSPVKPNENILFRYFPKERQKVFCEELLKQIGYDFAGGRLDTSAHPFTAGINPGDVRITTKYDERDFRTAVFSAIHEGGHALYEQNIAGELVGTPLCTGTSMGIHESQSLFYENFIGRNYHFWKRNFGLLNECSGGLFTDLSLDDFYLAINVVRPSLIRIEADELTYTLHIIIRYEIEKALFNEEIHVAELPEIWREKYEKYLGVTPEHDGEGVLQDIHWASGSFGYFPSYALGFIYGAQFKQALMKDLPQFDQLLREGNLLPVKRWFNRKVHQFGKMKEPLELVKDATGEDLNPAYFIDYLEKKYSALYRLSS